MDQLPDRRIVRKPTALWLTAAAVIAVGDVAPSYCALARRPVGDVAPIYGCALARHPVGDVAPIYGFLAIIPSAT